MARKNRVIPLSVSDFALPVPRVGSIETHSGYGPVPNFGAEIHLEIQKRRLAEFSEYEAEARVAMSFERKGYRFLVSGRMDGVFRRAVPRVEEIKSAFNIEELWRKLSVSPDHPYRRQALTYAYFLYRDSGIVPEVALHIVSARTRDGRDLELTLDLDEYETWLHSRLDELVVEARQREKTEARRVRAARQLNFPFAEARPGQTELMATVETAIREKKYLLAQAPTGLGKTAGVLYPILKESLGRGQKVVYVTPKNSQHAVAEDAVRRFQEAGAKVKALTINAKSKMCLKAETLCNPEYCEYARDYYTKLHSLDLKGELRRKRRLTPRTFRKFGETHQVCPFELQMDCLDLTDVVICDYNYVFSPRNAVGRMTHDGTQRKNKPNLIVDEVHNLPSRAMDYFSPQVTSWDLERVGHDLNRVPPAFATEGRDFIARALSLLKRQRPPDLRGSAAEITLDPEPFLRLDQELREYLNRYLASDAVIATHDPVLSLCHLWGEFTAALGYPGGTFTRVYKESRAGAALKIVCCDASEFLSEAWSAFQHVATFSATVKPFEYYSRLCGLPAERLQTAEFPSPFPAEHRKLLIIPQVSTKYSERARNSGKITEAIERIVRLKPGNYFVFFPSFEFLEMIVARVTLPEFEIVVQEREMKNQRVKAILDRLKNPERPILVFAVQGGVFAEGVDYPGDMLIGAIIVGPGLPSFDFERELLKAYYERRYGKGFEYAYVYPAMAKVVQAAGRVIRSAEDRGLVVLMDQRFLSPTYTQPMPVDWMASDVQDLVSRSVLKSIAEFWQREVPR